MNDDHKTKAELIKELEALRQQVAHIEEAGSNSRYAEEVHKESQKRYRALFENSPLGLWEFNPDGTTIYMNQAMCAMLEIESPEDLNGKTYHSFFTPQSLETMAKEQAKRYQGVASSYEVEIIGKKGGKRKVLLQGTLVSSSEEELKSLIGIFIDITERSLAVENLRKWAYIFEYADWGVGIVGAEGMTLVLMNPAFARMHGYTEEELIGRPITEVFAPEYRYDVPEQIWMADEKNHYIIESKHIRKDGTVFPVQIDVTVVKDKEGRVQFRAVHVQDITIRKRAEKALIQSEERYRTILDNTQEGYFEVDLAGNFTFVNDAECNDLGYTREELVGMNYKQYTDETAAKRLYKLFNRVFRTGEQIRAFDGEFIKKDGTKGFNQVSVSLIRNKEGKPVGFRGLSRDITERKQAEELLLASEARLKAQYQGSPIPTFTWQKKGENFELVDYNNAAKVATKGEALKFLGKTANEMYQDRLEILQDIHRCFTKKEIIKKELRSQHFMPCRTIVVTYIFVPPDFIMVHTEDITERKEAEEALKTLSLKDDLTGLYNRRGFFTLAEQSLKTAQRMGTEMVLIFGDLDNLKGINDTFGHKEGDRALVDTSKILKKTFRESDIIARIGGDEFVILAMNSVETTAEKLINRFEQVLNDYPLQTKRPYTLSLSLGLAFFDPKNPCSIDVLITQADKIMYENKQKKGR